MSTIEDIAKRHDVPIDAAQHVVDAIARGGGTMAQFNHPALGGMGQWHAGGMTMVGDMFNDGLKARVVALCNELAPLAADHRNRTDDGRSATWWPADLGVPSTSGAQNNTRYAYFPATQRLAIETAGTVKVYETGDHRISGVSQQQGSGSDLSFSSQLGSIQLRALREIGSAPKDSGPSHDKTNNNKLNSPKPLPSVDALNDPLATLERLAELHKKGVLTDSEFSSKKAELLSRL